ncbi:MAG: 5-formyltetrahydrofolate cyclo-ligase [Clostridiales bacterium]|nr:5-formyltetrahydrofolate cyclo-ligase [Clostridiales bacterium]
MNTMKLQKAAMREKYKNERKLIGDDERRAMSDEICRRATALSSFRLAQTVLLYAPKSHEVDVYPIAKEALARGKRVAFPRCGKKEDGTILMTFHTVSSLSELHPGSFGIMEPEDDAPLYEIDADKRSSIAFAPGITFDRHGYRIGYGGGYYDRYFSSYTGTIVGVVFSQLLTDEIPHGKYDIKAGLIITEKGVTATEG